MKKGAVALIISTDGTVLLQKRDQKSGITNPGKISMFGGSVEEGETVEAALGRELEEELGMKIEKRDITKLGTYYKSVELDGEEYEINVFVVRGIDATKLNLYEGEEIYHLDTHENPNNLNMTRITKLAIKDYLKLK